MSVLFESEAGGPRWRRAVDADRAEIAALSPTPPPHPWFGDVDIGRLIELSTLSICLVERGRVVGFAALDDSPGFPAVPPHYWEHWLRNMYQRFYLSRNTLFVRHLACADDAAATFVELALRSVFANDAYLQQIVFLLPSSCPDEVINQYGSFKRRKFLRVSPQRPDAVDGGYDLLVAARVEFYPKLRVRRAVEEDNDDIVEILDQQCPLLKELYGNFYISEIVGQRPSTQRRVIVSDSGDTVMGVMCLNSEVDYTNLQETYELRPYYGLRQPTALHKEKLKIGNRLLECFGEPILEGHFGPYSRLVQADNKTTRPRLRPRGEKISVQSARKVSNKVNFGGSAQKFDRTVESDDNSELIELDWITQSAQMQSTMLEADPFDYEIVNIDYKLLSVPSLISIDFYGTTSKQPSVASDSIKKKAPRKTKRNRARKLISSNVNHVYYEGAPNAFAIELFGMRPDCEDMQPYDLLEAAFETMPLAEYCIIRVPTTDKCFSLLQHFTFVPVQSNASSSYALYVAHRNSVLGKLRVREAEFADVPQLAILLGGLEARQTLWAVEYGVRRPRRCRPYVLLSGLSVVGLAILEPSEQVEYIRAKYDLDRYHSHRYHFHGVGSLTDFASLKTALVSPAFEPHFRFFTRELLRLSESSALLWLTAYRNKSVVSKANTLITAMAPAMPRRSQIDCVDIPEMRQLSVVSKEMLAFCTWFLNKKLTSVPQVTINTRIVVVGASDTALGFFDSLLFSDASTYLTFTSVTLVSPRGLPCARNPRPPADLMFLTRRYSTDKHLKSVPYKYYINVMPATMVGIDRQNKFITMSTSDKTSYDMLLILVGRQHQLPRYMDEIFQKQEQIQQGVRKPYTRLDIPQNSDPDLRLVKYETPENVFIINEIHAANYAINVVNRITWKDSENRVVVYGASLPAYCCLTALLKLRVPPKNITFVEPFPPQPPSRTRVSVFANPYVDHTVREVIKSLGVEIYSGYFFEDWFVTPLNVISHATFVSEHHQLVMPCAAFFFYGDKGVDAHAFSAMSKCGMAYDGGTLVDHKFRTKDPHIYAAGPGVRYYRRYNAVSRRHKYFDSFEVGRALGTQIRNQLDPLYQAEPTRPTNRKKEVSIFDILKEDLPDERPRLESSDIPTQDKLPTFRQPLVAHCRLPGGLQYLDVRPPTQRTPHHYMQNMEFNGIVLETFKDGYFKLHLTHDLVVDGVTCLSSTKLSLDNFRNLYGQSARVLNNVHLRFAAKQLDNLYEFFREPWAFFQYHDKRDDLLAVVRELVPQGSQNVTLREALSFIGDRLSTASYNADTKYKLRSIFEKSSHVEAITAQVIEWLSEYDRLLPMYMQPNQTVLFQVDMQREPCFTRRKRKLENMIWM